MNDPGQYLYRQQGYTLLEAALAVLLMGIVLSTIMVARNQSAAKVGAAEASFMDTTVTLLVNYAKRNNRLPCPDINADGLEDAVNGICTVSTDKTGGIPYGTIGMALSSPVGTGLDQKYVYAVYRGQGVVDRDLTVNAERSLPTPHVAPNVSYANLDDFKQALLNAAAASNPVDASEIYVTGNEGNSGAANCGANQVANVAFVVAYAGVRNADGQGSDFDGEHLVNVGWNASTKWSSVRGNTCFVGPGRATSPTFDDEVKAVGFLELIGMVSR